MLTAKPREFYIFIPLFLAYFVLALFFPFLKTDIVKFLLFQLLFMLLPGYIFSKLLIRDSLSRIQRLLFGYPVSLAVLFILSWLGNALGIRHLENIMLLFSLISFYKMVKDRNGESPVQGGPIYAGAFFYSVCTVIVFRMFILPSSPPSPYRLGLFYQDSLWNLGVTWSYIRGFPLEDSKFSGVLTGYHMLKHIYQAIVYKFTRIDPFNIHFFIEPLFDWFIMVFLIFYGGIRIAKFSLRKIIIFCSGLFFGSAFLGAGLQGTLFINPLTTYFSITPLVLFIFYIIGYLNGQRELDIAYMTILYANFTATKSMLGIIIAAALFILFILNLFKKSIPFSYKHILLGLGMVLSAVLLRITMISHSMHRLTYDYDPSASFAYKILSKIYFLGKYVDVIYPFYRFWSSFVRNLPQYILNWPFLLFVIVFFFSKEFRKQAKSMNRMIVFISVFFLVAISMMCLVDFPGIRIYFFWYVQVAFLTLGVIALDFIFEKNYNWLKVLAFSFIAFAITFTAAGIKEWKRLGWGSLPGIKERVWDKRASISYDEWLAMKWMQRNISVNKIFFSDRRYFSHELTGEDMPRFYGYSALSGRQAFAEGETSEAPADYKSIAIERWNLINAFLSSADPKQQAASIKKIPADYFVQSLRFDKNNFLKADNLSLVYENKEIKIFMILK